MILSCNYFLSCVGSLLSHAESLVPSFLNEEDVQLLRWFRTEFACLVSCSLIFDLQFDALYLNLQWMNFLLHHLDGLFVNVVIVSDGVKKKREKQKDDSWMSLMQNFFFPLEVF